MHCTVPKNPSPSDRLMSWPESRSSLIYIYNHLFQNFDKFWDFMFATAPSATVHFIPFALVGFEASKKKEISCT